MDARDGILRAAQVVFARHGYRQTAMAMVAEEAGLSRQALYHHFASKEALFAALVDALHEEALAAARVAGASLAPRALDVITGLMLAHHRSVMARVAGSPFAAELIEESGRQCGPAVLGFSRKLEKELEASIARLVRAGRFSLKSGTTARELAEMIHIAAKGVKTAYAGESEARYAAALKRMIEVICAGAAAPGKMVQKMGTARRIAR